MAQRSFSGKVSDSNGQPVAGATVQVKGSNTQTITDNAGNFSITAADGARLVISSVGFSTREVAAADASSVSLTAEAKDLGEVVVTALGIRKEKKKLGYAIQEVKGEDLTVARETNVVNQLAGKGKS